jgi:hypothetical protein
MIHNSEQLLTNGERAGSAQQSAQFPTRVGSRKQLGAVPIALGQIREYRTRHALHFHTLQECISKHSNAQIKECNSKHRPNNSAQFPMLAGSTKHGTTRMHFGTLKCTDQGMQLQTTPLQLATVANACKICNACPHTIRMHLQTLKCTDHGMRLQTSPQQLGTVSNARSICKARHSSHGARTNQRMHFETLPECISKDSHAQIEEYGSRNAAILHRSRNIYRSNAVIEEYSSSNANPTQRSRQFLQITCIEMHLVRHLSRAPFR